MIEKEQKKEAQGLLSGRDPLDCANPWNREPYQGEKEWKQFAKKVILHLDLDFVFFSLCYCCSAVSSRTSALETDSRHIIPSGHLPPLGSRDDPTLTIPHD